MSRIHIRTYVDLDDVFDDISDEQLMKELSRRSSISVQVAIKAHEEKMRPLTDILDELESQIMRGDKSGALFEIARLRGDRTNEELTTAYLRAANARDPKTGRPVIQ